MTNNIQAVLLVILDGFGVAPAGEFNAITRSKAPFIHQLLAQKTNSLLGTCGEAVGLPAGVMGNSEVGHMNIGSGRVVMQDLVRINHAIRHKEFYQNKVFLDQIHQARDKHKTLHLMGLLSDAGVHAHNNHLYELLKLCKQEGLEKVSVHAFLDGRDTPPNSGIKYVKELETKLKEIGIGKIASLSGRYFVMDRDNRWERSEQAWRALWGEAPEKASAEACVQEFYDQNTTDEFIPPTIINKEACLAEGDSIICFNYRADRVRQISAALALESFSDFSRNKPCLSLTTMTSYKSDFPFPVAFPKIALTHLIGDVVADAGLKQLRAAETEKYAHVTFFFNGGKELQREGEKRILIDSPKDVSTYDQKPEMSAPQLTKSLCAEIQKQEHSFIVANYANADMVGHTGNLEASIQAIEALNQCLEQLYKTALAHNYSIFLTADHGNIEEMQDKEGNLHTQHTLNPVPFVYSANKANNIQLQNGKLADIMPTILQTMNLNIPAEVSGKNLLIRNK